ncbi:MAG: TetR/AcrR family transcriptional regulator [Myxococcota bacterium]
MRRPVQERSVATRRVLLDATYEALLEVGYARTSTAEICRRAGTARGTMLHHYPTRDALIVATMEDVMVRRLEAFRASVLAVAPPEGASTERIVRGMFDAVRGPEFEAWLELTTAARTEPSLRAELRSLVERWDALVEETAQALFPDVPREELRVLIAFVFATINGLALDHLFDKEQEAQDALTKLIQAVEAIRPPEPGSAA